MGDVLQFKPREKPELEKHNSIPQKFQIEIDSISALNFIKQMQESNYTIYNGELVKDGFVFEIYLFFNYEGKDSGFRIAMEKNMGNVYLSFH